MQLVAPSMQSGERADPSLRANAPSATASHVAPSPFQSPADVAKEIHRLAPPIDDRRSMSDRPSARLGSLAKGPWMIRRTSPSVDEPAPNPTSSYPSPSTS